MNFINKFNTTEDFINSATTLDNMPHFIAYDVESDNVWLKDHHLPLDILYYDKINQKTFIAKGNYWAPEFYPAENFTPLGIVVIPSSHDVYGDKSCGIMSLKWMSCDDPQNGSNSLTTMVWGDGSTDISALTNYNTLPYVGSLKGNRDTISGYTQASVYLPSDVLTGAVCYQNNNLKYYADNTDDLAAPTPFLFSGLPNMIYRTTAATATALSDFKGKENTDIILAQRGDKSEPSWKPNSSTSSDYPAVSCCNLFAPEGMNKGDWYLPSCGELSYAFAHKNDISNIITVLNETYSTQFTTLASTVATSTEVSSSTIMSIQCMNGHVASTEKNIVGHVRAFTRFNEIAN